MLNGIDPIIIFTLFKNVPPPVALEPGPQPLVETSIFSIPFTPIPIYLSERVTGLYIDTQSKNIDIETKVTTLPSAESPEVTQKGVNSSVTINMLANSGSIGLTIFSAMCDLIFQRLTSKEYRIDFIDSAFSIFGGLLAGYSINQSANDSLYRISFELSKSNGGSTIEKVASATVPNTAVETLSDTTSLQLFTV